MPYASYLLLHIPTIKDIYIILFYINALKVGSLICFQMQKLILTTCEASKTLCAFYSATNYANVSVLQI